MTVLQAMLLGLVQGVAEFLPISSSGHLSILQNLMGLTAAEESCMLFDVLLHLGTLVSVCVAFWDDIVDIVRQCLGFLRGLGHPVPEQEKKRYPAVRLLMMICFATLPLVLVLPIKDYVEELYYSTLFIGIALIGTGTMLYIADRMPKGRRTEKNMGIVDALLVGVCQAIATIPGLSRSGTTITAGLSTGMDRQFAVKFSFLISIPAVLGANLLSLGKALKAGIDWGQMPAYILGMLVAMVSGYYAIALVRRVSKKGKFGYFAYYCWAVGALTLILSVLL